MDEPRDTTMTALRAHQRGGPEQLVVEPAPRPQPGNGEVLVRVEAAAITADELTWPETWEVDGADRTPIIPSHEFAGVVAGVGADTEGFSVGDEVFGLVPFDRDGAAADSVVVPVTTVAHRSSSVSAQDAAAAVLPALTAWEALSDHVRVSPGQRLLVRGGTGAVGGMLTQIAHVRGAEVTVTVSSEAGRARAEALGADHVVVVPRGTVPAGLAGFHAAVDAVGDDVPAWLYEAVGTGGVLVTLQTPPDQELAARSGISAVFFVVTPDGGRLSDLDQLLASGRLTVAVSEVFPLAAGRAAYVAAKAPGRTPGKVLLVP